MYEDASKKVRMNGRERERERASERERERESRAFNDKVGVHQDSVFQSAAIHHRACGFVYREFREGYLRKSAIMQLILS